MSKVPEVPAGWKGRAGRLKGEIYALYLAYRDPRTPWYAKLLAALVAGYAFSPIDLVPDAIPILGYLDDLLLVPLGIALALRMVPQVVMEECREQARVEMARAKPTSRAAAVAIVVVWLFTAVALAVVVYGLLCG